MLCMAAQKRRHKRIPSATDKLVLQLQEELRALTQVLAPHREPAPLFSRLVLDWDEWYSASGVKHSTLVQKHRSVSKWLIPLFGNRPADGIGPPDGVALRDQMLDAGCSPATVNDLLGLLLQILRWGAETGALDRVPVIRLMRRAKKRKEALPSGAYAKMLAVARVKDWDWWVAMLLCGDAGLRASEAAGLEWSAVDLGSLRLAVVAQDYRGELVDPKSVPRAVPIGAELAVALSDPPRATVGRILRAQGGGVTTRRRIWHWFTELAKLAGVDSRGGVHRLRHLFLSELAAAGVDSTTLRDLAGHHSVAITDVYLHAAKGAGERAIAARDEARAKSTATDSETESKQWLADE